MLETTEGCVTLHPTIGKVALITATTSHPQARVRCHERISGFSTSFPGSIYYFCTFVFFSSTRSSSFPSPVLRLFPQPCVFVYLSPPLLLSSIPYFHVYSSPRPHGSCQKLPDGYSSHPSLILEGDYPTTSLTGNQISRA
jgi:hypothetical protein